MMTMQNNTPLSQLREEFIMECIEFEFDLCSNNPTAQKAIIEKAKRMQLPFSFVIDLEGRVVNV